MKSFAFATLVLLLLVALLGAHWEHWVLAALDPGVAFDAAAAPAAPDYSDLASWTAHPKKDDPADFSPLGSLAADQALAPVDVFYVHPTSYLGSNWSGPADDPVLNARTDELATLIQASAFNACCAVYGPRYRQANGNAFLRPGADGDAAIDLAYGDVRRAFRFFLAEHSRGRPFVLAGHSQGSVLAARLLREEIAGAELAERLVAAYLVGAPIPASFSPGVPVCEAGGQAGCLVTWNARGLRFSESRFDFEVSGEPLCVNPLSWRHDEAPAAASLNQGAVFLHAGRRAPLPGFADAQCQDGVLRISQMGDPPRDFMSRVLDFLMGPENYHPIEYQLFYMNLRTNAQQRVASYLRERSSATQ